MQRTSTLLRLGAVLAFGAALGGCADIYYDRRETVSMAAGEAVETNKATHIIDPWPKASANRTNRTNKTTPLQTTSTSSVKYDQAPPGAAPIQ